MSGIVEELVKALNGYGPSVAIVATLIVLNVFFIWRDFKRERDQQKQIDALHQAHNEIVLPLLADCKEAIASCKEVIYQNSQIITSWLNRKA